MKKNRTNWMIKVAMLSATSTVLMLFEFPLPFIAPSFYELDFSEVPALLGAFALGPLAGIVIELIKILLNFLINGTITAGIGEFANFLIGVSFILPAELIYQKRKTKLQAIFGLTVGGIAMTVFGCLVNAYILLPAYGNAFGMPIGAFVEMGTKINPMINSVWKLVLLCTAPFNIIKAILVSTITLLIYKPLSPILKKN